MKTLILALSLIIQSPNLIPIQEVPVEDYVAVDETEGLKHFADSASLAKYWLTELGDKKMVSETMKTFDTDKYNYVRIVYVGDCNTRVRYSLEKEKDEKALFFRYSLFSMGASPCRGANLSMSWLRYPKQQGYRFVDKS